MIWVKHAYYIKLGRTTKFDHLISSALFFVLHFKEQ